MINPASTRLNKLRLGTLNGFGDYNKKGEQDKMSTYSKKSNTLSIRSGLAGAGGRQMQAKLNRTIDQVNNGGGIDAIEEQS